MGKCCVPQRVCTDVIGEILHRPHGSVPLYPLPMPLGHQRSGTWSGAGLDTGFGPFAGVSPNPDHSLAAPQHIIPTIEYVSFHVAHSPALRRELSLLLLLVSLNVVQHGHCVS